MEKVQQKHRGAYNELLAVMWLLREGYEVYRNVSQHGIGDIVAFRGDVALILDVKAAGLRADGSRGRQRLSGEQIVRGVKCLNVYDDGHVSLDMDPPVKSGCQTVCIGCGKKFHPDLKTTKVCGQCKHKKAFRKPRLEGTHNA